MKVGKGIWVNRAELEGILWYISVGSEPENTAIMNCCLCKEEREVRCMEKRYNKRKYIVIILLSVIAVGLCGGLFWYLGRRETENAVAADSGNIGNGAAGSQDGASRQGDEVKEATNQQAEVPAEGLGMVSDGSTEDGEATDDQESGQKDAEPKDEMSGVQGSSQNGGMESESEPSGEQNGGMEPESKPSGSPESGQGGDSKSEPEGGMNPEQSQEPPVEQENGEPKEYNPQPEQTQQGTGNPQGGEKRSDGAIYVPGFGWIEDSGEANSTTVAPNAGTGDAVGDM